MGRNGPAVARHHRTDPSGRASVVLDIGGYTGALVVRAPLHRVGHEVEIRRVGAAWDGQHVAVRVRDTGVSVLAAALFGPLEAGAYQVRWRHEPEAKASQAAVEPGRVSDTVLAGG